MKKKREIPAVAPLEERIFTIRDKKVILDTDLSAIYDVTTTRLNEQFRRNRERFPADFAFQLTAAEWAVLRSQIATLKSETGQHRKYRPCVFTEHGALMAADIPNSAQSHGLVARRDALLPKLLSAELHVTANRNCVKYQ